MKSCIPEQLTKYIALDCEFTGIKHNRSCLGRVSIFNFDGTVMLDRFVKPIGEPVKPRNLVSSAISYKQARKEIGELLKDKIIVGHGIRNDLKALSSSHPQESIRDTTKFPEFRKLSGGNNPSLKTLAKHYLNMEIQKGKYDSIEDARTTMSLFRLYQDEFEQYLVNKRK